MTKVVIFKSKSHILGFEISGHSGYAEEGSDIVCSAISSISQMVVVGIKDVLKIGAFVEISNGYLKLNLSQKDAENESVSVLLKVFEKSARGIVKEYGNYVKMEVKNVF